MQKAREKIRPPKGGQNLVKVLAIYHLLKNDNSFYKNAIKLIDSGELDINELLDSLILNNIASINKTLKFED